MAPISICSIPECGKPVVARDICNAHYKRLRRHGDPLGGGTSPGELMRFVHEVALPHKGNECLIWPFGKKGDGYGFMKIDADNYMSVHRYVCILAHGEPIPSDLDSAHSCGNGHLGCISPTHLSWKTRAANMADKFDHGTDNRGERNNMSKMTREKVREILKLKGVKPQKAIAAEFGIARQTVSKIHRRERWDWLD